MESVDTSFKIFVIKAKKQTCKPEELQMCDFYMLQMHFQQVLSRSNNGTAPHLPPHKHPAQMHQQRHLPVVLVADKTLKNERRFVLTGTKVKLYHKVVIIGS